jgi:NAD(P)-dependent dehydrogenase (short-subunit alcohol dehydrogenase family)
VPVDVTEREQLENLFDRCLAELGRLDVAVNNAGGSNFASPLLSLRPEGWDKVLALNLDSVFHATQLAAERMVDRGGGSIIQMSSVAGLQGAETLSFYSAAKAGVRLMTQAVARELAASGVRVNSLAPGWVATDLNAGMWRDDATRSEMESRIPMGRLGLADEIVGPAIFLASDASSFVTGTTLVVDGGQLA